jgi:hypothetical protein
MARTSSAGQTMTMADDEVSLAALTARVEELERQLEAHLAECRSAAPSSDGLSVLSGLSERLAGPDAKYQQLAAVLRELIRTGAYSDRIPSAAALHQETGLAMLTVRHAVDLLKTEDLVVARSGRGTFVRRRA